MVYAESAGPAWGKAAFEALRTARGAPRLGWIPTRPPSPMRRGWFGSAVRLDKGCYRGRETPARVHKLGKPARQLILHLTAPTTAFRSGLHR
jgi:folate-binding Fe-S cluster repair protein YgfZ